MSLSEGTPDLLRLTTAGSVDDGKSTLIGRLLYDSRQLLDDQLEQVMEASRRRSGEGTIDLALITDGLRAEREQGITIDVAYRFFGTPRRRFIIADVPGHHQYTRNMVTGASTADLSVVLVDARAGIVEQSKRHAFLSTLLRIPHLVLAVNKMDLVAYSAARFDDIVADFDSFVGGLGAVSVAHIPVSALVGDNVVTASMAMPWYTGPTLLQHLEQVVIDDDNAQRAARFPVQWVVRGPASGEYRGYAGQIASGTLHRGDAVVVLPSQRVTTIASIDTFNGPVAVACTPQSVMLALADNTDVSRGDLICPVDNAPLLARDLAADVCWMADSPLRVGDRYAIKQMTQTAVVTVSAVRNRLDVHTLQRIAADELILNDIGHVEFRASTPLVADTYAQNRHSGRFILIDEASNETVAAGMITPSPAAVDGR